MKKIIILLFGILFFNVCRAGDPPVLKYLKADKDLMEKSLTPFLKVQYRNVVDIYNYKRLQDFVSILDWLDSKTDELSDDYIFVEGSIVEHLGQYSKQASSQVDVVTKISYNEQRLRKDYERAKLYQGILSRLKESFASRASEKVIENFKKNRFVPRGIFQEPEVQIGQYYSSFYLGLGATYNPHNGRIVNYDGTRFQTINEEFNTIFQHGVGIANSLSINMGGNDSSGKKSSGSDKSESSGDGALLAFVIQTTYGMWLQQSLDKSVDEAVKKLRLAASNSLSEIELIQENIFAESIATTMPDVFPSGYSYLRALQTAEKSQAHLIDKQEKLLALLEKERKNGLAELEKQILAMINYPTDKIVKKVAESRDYEDKVLSEMDEEVLNGSKNFRDLQAGVKAASGVNAYEIAYDLVTKSIDEDARLGAKYLVPRLWEEHRNFFFNKPRQWIMEHPYGAWHDLQREFFEVEIR
jgi:hypothetical protein